MKKIIIPRSIGIEDLRFEKKSVNIVDNKRKKIMIKRKLSLNI
tara:strand:- start:989 stop:1117 length:129 start_codon:yes stop_codon:yes gene_type:complete